MSNTLAQIRWASRVKPLKIRRLYASDAKGMLDAELQAAIERAAPGRLGRPVEE